MALDYEPSIKEKRNLIDELDTCIIHLIKRRMDTSREIGEIKLKHNKPVLDKAREERHKADIRAIAEKCGLDKAFISEIFDLIISKSVAEQENSTRNI